MQIDKIGPRVVITPNNFDPIDPHRPVDRIVRIEPDEYKFDSIKQSEDAKDAWDKIFPGIAPAMFPQLNQARPVLEAPQLEVSKLSAVDTELRNVIPLIEKKGATENQNPDLTEIQLLYLFLACSKMQREQNQTDVELTHDIVIRKQQANKIVTQEFFLKQDELIDKNKKSKWVRWINWIFGGALAVAGAGSIAMTVASGGAALPVALVVLNATLAIGTGTSKIFQGILKQKSDELRGEIELKKFERNSNNEKIRSGMEEMNKSAENVAESWKLVSEVIRNSQMAMR